jgi:uncharacterized membrane protein
VKREQDPRAAGLCVLAVATLVASALVPFARQRAFPAPVGLWWGLGAGVFEGLYFAALGWALARGPLGPVYTVARGGAMLVAWPISVLLLGESFPWPARFGVALIGAGLGLATLRAGERVAARSLEWALVCAFAIAGYHLCYKLALQSGSEPRALFAVALACALPINAACLGRGVLQSSLSALRRSPLRMLAGGVTCTASFVIFLEALSLAGAGAVLTLRNTSILFAQAFAVWGGERPSQRVLGGAALVVVGAFLLAQ